MKENDPLPELFRAERQKLISELRYVFAIQTEVIEDLVSDTFLSAAERWKGDRLPQNPAAWLHTVARNKAKNYLKKKAIFDKKLTPELRRTSAVEELEYDFAESTIDDTQLAILFAICNPSLPDDAQVGLALNLFCGVQEIADAFLTTKHVIYKRLERAKEKLRVDRVSITRPTSMEIRSRLGNVLTSLYLLFSEGHCSFSQCSVVRENLCTEAMRLNYLLIENPLTNTPAANALFALMCFHSSRFAARMKEGESTVTYDDQDEALWDKELMERGRYHLKIAASGRVVSKFHLEAGIAFWHTQKEDSKRKWESILDLYNKLLALEYSPVAALNRTYALFKVRGKKEAIIEAENLNLSGNLLHRSLLGFLYNGLDDTKALTCILAPAGVAHYKRQEMFAD